LIDRQLDVLLEIPKAEADRQAWRPGEFGQMVIERCRGRAEALVEEAGGRLHTDRGVEVIISEGVSPLLGEMVLVATRWWASVPDRA
jgi:hypothetical protein